jgi:hypothetical protein
LIKTYPVYNLKLINSYDICVFSYFMRKKMNSLDRTNSSVKQLSIYREGGGAWGFRGCSAAQANSSFTAFSCTIDQLVFLNFISFKCKWRKPNVERFIITAITEWMKIGCSSSSITFKYLKYLYEWLNLLILQIKITVHFL